MSMEIDKSIPVDRLIALLRCLPPGCLVECNMVRNLVVLDQYGNYVGFIDFEDGSGQPFDDRTELGWFDHMVNRKTLRGPA